MNNLLSTVPAYPNITEQRHHGQKSAQPFPITNSVLENRNW